ncbi:hypothetical protein [Pseudonocardia kunmingensis]|uniref:Uncharacterized protein n=1 Tax=Pseudonocardia kunmingensis TaxID=630975 RepID=A0A543DR41_9PSEU|nr:hypothetical protein [Pseudonocardia kunmingensis]TQM11791.1 hypothetical protein FB558_4363 [Pseudonocardia kunmingensis]
MATTDNGPALTALRAVGIAPDTYGPTINTARSPRAVDVIGERLAGAIRGCAVDPPQALLVWDTSDEAVLAHAVARCLDVGVLRASEVEGRLGLDRDLEPGTLVVPMATQWVDRRLATLRKLVDNRGGRTVAVAAVLGSAALAAARDVPTAAVGVLDEATGLLP